ncbi:MAG TPA: hypothetical protein VEC12_03830, partial [Bacteroidia bacterium]|nr:hypothetical protein [Bacteroidia bacterium]
MLPLLFFLLTSSAFAQALSGVKTIDASGSGPNNYTSFTAAVNDLMSKGVNGPVLFQVAAGTYTGQITIRAVSGASATNTVTFDGGFGNADTRIVTYSASSATDAHVIRLDNSSYIHLKNLTFKNTGTSAGLGISIFGNANNCEIVGCNVYVDSTSTSTNFKAIQMTNSTSSSDGGYCGGTSASPYNITIDSNTIAGGYFGFYGTSNYSTSAPHILFIRNNTIRLAYNTGIGISSVRGYEINYNYVNMRAGVTASRGFTHCNGGTSGVQAYDMIGNIFENCGEYGIHSQTRNNNGARGKLWNNFIKGTFLSANARGIYLNYDRNMDVWHNTIVIQNNIGTNGAGLWVSPSGYPNDVVNNNILITDPNASGFAINSLSGTIANSDYNNYYKVNDKPGQFLVAMNGTQLTKQNFRGFSGFDMNSYSEDPNLVSADDPRPLSACLRGIYLSSSSVDLFQTTRSNPPTVGAAESAGGLALDMAVDAFLQPSFPIPSGNNDVEVRIRNKGTNTITSVDVSIQLGSVTHTINWTGSLIACDDTTILFTGSNQLNIGPGQNTIKAWVASPNNDTDENNSNDTISQSFCSPFAAGTYTIDPAGSGPNNYTTIKQVTDIINCGGISGPVTFNLAATTFNETIDLLFVKGASSVNRITFKGAGVG